MALSIPSQSWPSSFSSCVHIPHVSRGFFTLQREVEQFMRDLGYHCIIKGPRSPEKATLGVGIFVRRSNLDVLDDHTIIYSDVIGAYPFYLGSSLFSLSLSLSLLLKCWFFTWMKMKT